MIHLVLNDLCRPAGEVFRARLHFQGLILNLDSLIPLTLTGAAEKRQTTFLGVVRAVLLDDLKAQSHTIINSNPEYEVALMGLLSDDDHKMARESGGFMHIGWTNKAETNWIPYIKGRNYLSQNNGSLWVGTWWMPGLDIDYAIVIVGDDARITPNGFVGIPRHSKNYLMMISIAEQLGVPDRIVKANTANSTKVEAILNYLDLPQNAALKATFNSHFTFYLRNMYYVMMTRGRKACLVYFKNRF